MSVVPPRSTLNARAVGKRIFAAIVTGVFAYLISALTNQEPIVSLMLSLLIGGIVLLAQLLIDFGKVIEGLEVRMEGVERVIEMARLHDAAGRSTLNTSIVARLLESTARFGDDDAPVVKAFAEYEVSKTADLLTQLNQGHVISHDGEALDWLLSVTRSITTSLDATSTVLVDGKGNGFEGGFWSSDSGRRYLKAQEDAIHGRQVTVRRLFIMENVADFNEDDFLPIAKTQMDAGIKIRALQYDRLPSVQISPIDFILFDGKLTYELIPSNDPYSQGYLHTFLNRMPAHVAERQAHFERLWEIADRHSAEQDG